VHRIGDTFIGVVCIVWAIAMAWGLSLLPRMGPLDVWTAIGVTVGATLYGIVVELLVLLGLQKILGPDTVLDSLLKQSKTTLWVAMTVAALLVAVVLIFII